MRGLSNTAWYALDESLLSSFISKSVFAASIRERVTKTRGMKKEGGKDTADVLAFNLGNL